MADSSFLHVSGIAAGYRGGRVLDEVSLSVDRGESLAVLGRNGAGKTTLVRAITRTIPVTAGDILLAGRSLRDLPPHQVSRRGVGLVPQGRGIWPNLTVTEHLTIAARSGGPWDRARVLELFPQLAGFLGRRAETLSGGEQQMLAIARALVTNPVLLVLDEPFEGLAPAVREVIHRALAACLSTGTALLLVEHDLRIVADLAQRVVIIDRGAIAFEAETGQFRRSRETVQALLGVG